MDIIFQARHTDVLERFRKHAMTKLSKIEKLDSRAIRVDVEVSAEHNPRQAGRKERVELTVTSRGPAIRAEAAAEDRFTALDMAFAKLESRLRRSCDRRKDRHGAHAAVRLVELQAELSPEAGFPETGLAATAEGPAPAGVVPEGVVPEGVDPDGPAARHDGEPGDLIPIEMQGEGPLVVREKFHAAVPMSIDQALFEMELVGHDFFLFTDAGSGMPSVVYRRRGYQYGVIRLVEGTDTQEAAAAGSARINGQVQQTAPAPVSAAAASRSGRGVSGPAPAS